jgi:hypothetical protein
MLHGVTIPRRSKCDQSSLWNAKSYETSENWYRQLRCYLSHLYTRSSYLKKLILLFPTTKLRSKAVSVTHTNKKIGREKFTAEIVHKLLTRSDYCTKPRSALSALQQVTKHFTRFHLRPATCTKDTGSVCLLEYISNGSGFTTNHSLPAGPLRPHSPLHVLYRYSFLVLGGPPYKPHRSSKCSPARLQANARRN